MAKGKGGKSSGKVSAGIHSNVAKSTLKAMRAGYMGSGTRLINQRKAYNEGRNVVLTIPNPNKEQTNRRFIKVPARELWATKKK